jgi:hypothetical protein
MAFNPFLGWSVEDLLRELRSAQEDLAAGASITRAGASDATSEQRIDKSPEERIRIILRALNRIDPDTYPIADITPTDRTRIVFNGITSIQDQ